MKTAPLHTVPFALLLVACVSATSSGGSALPPDDAVAPDETGPVPSRPPSASAGPRTGPVALPDCPAMRDDDTEATDLPAPSDVRAMIAGVYRDCSDPEQYGMELREDPGSTTRIVWWSLDARFVRRGTPGTTGWLDVQSCEGSVCTVEWHVDDVATDPDPMKEMTLWTDPIAVRIEHSGTGGTSWMEWVRVAD